MFLYFLIDKIIFTKSNISYSITTVLHSNSTLIIVSINILSEMYMSDTNAQTTTIHKKLVQNVLNAALLGQTVTMQTHVRTHGRINGALKDIEVPVSFTGTLGDGIKVPQESAARLQGVLIQALTENNILPEGAFSIGISSPEKSGEVRLSVTIPDYGTVNDDNARIYLTNRTLDTTLAPHNTHHAKILHKASLPTEVGGLK
jgi:hypothetical protein